jgi:hypothetical protein
MRFIERDWLSANGVLFDDGHHTALIDSGYIKHADMTLSVIRHALGGRRLELLITDARRRPFRAVSVFRVFR